MNTLIAVALLLSTPPAYVEGPCRALHYGRNGVPGENNMQDVLQARICPGVECIPGFAPRKDVVDFIAVRYADRWRIAQNWRVKVVFKLPSGKYSKPMWLQPIDYQMGQHVTSGACRVEVSAKLAQKQGWSLWQDRGRTTAYIVAWQH